MAPLDGGPPVMPLPELPASQQGCSSASADHYTATVSNADGYMCHIHVEVEFPVPPTVLFEIFTHPDNSCAFRDIKRVGFRKVLKALPDLKIVEVEQLGAMRIMWGLERSFATLLRVTEDSRDPECLKTTFELVRSDILSRFQGAWHLTPLRDEAGTVVGCRGVLEQDVLPRGVPPFLAHLPVLGGLLRGASLNTIRRLIEDMTSLAQRVRRSGKTAGEVIEDVARERGHPHSHGGENWGASEVAPAVQSFALSDGGSSGSEEDEEEEEDEAAAADAQGAGRGQGIPAARGGKAAAAVAVVEAAAVPSSASSGSGVAVRAA